MINYWQISCGTRGIKPFCLKKVASGRCWKMPCTWMLDREADVAVGVRFPHQRPIKRPIQHFQRSSDRSGPSGRLSRKPWDTLLYLNTSSQSSQQSERYNNHKQNYQPSINAIIFTVRKWHEEYVLLPGVVLQLCCSGFHSAGPVCT